MNTVKFDEVRKLLSEAKKMTEQRLAQYPNYGPYIHAKEQLQEISKHVMNQSIPTEEEKEHIDIGIMAVRELESVDPEYAGALMDLASAYEDL